MYQSNFDFPDLEAIEPDVNAFYQIYLALSRLSEIEDDEEKKAILLQFQQYQDDTNTPLYLLVIIKRILVDGTEEYGNILELISFLNKLINNKGIVQYSIENEEYRNYLIFGMLFLLPYTASYFQSNGDITCFNNLLSSLFSIKNNFDDDTREIFNSYIDSLLVNFEDNIPNIIALKFASKVPLLEQFIDKVLQYSIYLLGNLRSYDLNDDSQMMLLYIFITENQINVSNFLTDRLLDPQILFESINAYFEFYLTKFNFKERIFPDNKEIGLIEKVIHFLSSTMKDYLNAHNLEDQEKHEFMTVMTRIVYEKSLDIVNSSHFYFSPLISSFLLEFLDYLDLELISQNKSYFCKLIQSLTIIRSTAEIMSAPQEILFIDYFDINFYSIDYLSNRQNVAQIIYNIVQRTNSIEILMILCRYLWSLKPEWINEIHLFILSVLNAICEIKSINKIQLLNPLAQLTFKFLNIGSEIISNSNMSYYKKNYFIFSYSFLINSNFYVVNFLNKVQLETQQQIEGFSDLVESETQIIRGWLDSLVSQVQNYSPDEEIDDNYYHIFFTFYCILVLKMIENGILQIEEEVLTFTNNYYSLCLTNDGIKLMAKIALETNNEEMIREIFDRFIDMSIEMALKTRPNEEEDQNENQNDDEEKDKNKNEHILRFFTENAAIISKMIKDIDMNPEMFIISDENKLVNFGRVLLTEDESDYWDFAQESSNFFSIVFSKAPNLNEWVNFYFEVPLNQFILNYCEWSIPISAVISNRPESIDQDLYNYIINVLKEYIEKTVEKVDDELKMINTIDFLYTNSLIIRLLELNLFPQIEISVEDFAYFSDFVINTLPSEDYCRISTDYDRKAHELGIWIFRLASFLVKNDDLNEIGEVFQQLINEGKVVCEEMRYMMIFLIDNLLNANDDENLRELRQRCLINDLAVDESAAATYSEHDDNFLCYVSHPIYKFNTIDNFVFD